MKSILNIKYVIYVLLFISFLSSLRNLLFPLVNDELQYAEIAKNIVTKGEYSLEGIPSTYTPTLPFLIALFYSKSFPLIGLIAVKLFNLMLMIIGLRFCYLFLRKTTISSTISLAIIMLTAVNNVTVAWSTAIYPDALLFCFFWIFIYFIIDEIKSPKQIFYFLIPLSILIITRYLYGVCLLIASYFILNCIFKLFKEKDFKSIYKLLVYSIICFLPLIIWFKYVYLVENEIQIDQSYFARFKNKDAFYNIKAGLGLIQHAEVDKVNGIPAFISLFVPATGLRNWLSSIFLITAFSLGYISKWKIKEYRLIFISIILIMFGLIVAGTGFNRYWLVLLPGFWLGFYFCFNYFKIKDYYFEKLALMASILYVINELRLDVLILNKL